MLEPADLVELFMRFPPEGFTCQQSAGGLPVFQTEFDLLTTLEPRVASRIRRLPLYRSWARLLRFPTRFAGTTVTEYAPLPDVDSPAGLPEQFRDACADGQSFLIIKDIPESSPLLGEYENTFSERLVTEQRDFMLVEGQALAYVPIDFPDTDTYLSRLSKSRRKNLRRKLKSRERMDIASIRLGDARFMDTGFLDTLYSLYQEVFAQSEIHFDLLTRDFFTALFQSRTIPGVVFLYSCGGELAGYNLCLEHNGMLIDKYIGLHYPLARELDLYFVSWFVNLEYALQHGLKYYIAGWTDPEVKASLGAKFTFTRHLVWIRNPLLRRLLYRFRHFFEADAKVMAE